MRSTPAVLDGVGASCVQLPAGAWATVLDFLVARFANVPAQAWQQRIARGLVVDGQGRRIDAATPYRAGISVYYYRELDREPPIPFEPVVLHRDEHLLAVDKPHFLPVTPAGRYVQQSVLVRLKRELGLEALAPLHRIDRGTAGVVLFSTDAPSRGRYQALFAQRLVRKVYEALAPALPQLHFPLTRRSRIVAGEPFFRMREAEGEDNAETHIDVIEVRGELALYRLQPLTGRKHQLRVHMAALGAPIVGDSFYPQLQPDRADDYTRPLKLLARSIAFDDPITGQAREFASRLRL